MGPLGIDCASKSMRYLSYARSEPNNRIHLGMNAFGVGQSVDERANICLIWSHILTSLAHTPQGRTPIPQSTPQLLNKKKEPNY